MNHTAEKQTRRTVAVLLAALLLALTLLSGCDPEEIEGEGALSYSAEAMYNIYYDVCAIPRSGSAYPSQINAYIKEYAQSVGLTPVEDAAGNVVVEVPATEGLAEAPVVIFQTYTDAVIAYAPSLLFDPDVQGVEVSLNTANRISAQGMSMGADSAGGITTLLALMHTENAHGPYRLIFTAYGTSTCSGARQLDARYLEGGLLVNVSGDSVTSVVGGSRFADVRTTEAAITTAAVTNRYAYVLAVADLAPAVTDTGNRTVNAVSILTEVLSTAKGAGIQYELCSFETVGGSPYSPQTARAVVVLNDYEQSKFRQTFNSVTKTYKDSATGSPDMRMIETVPPAECLSNEDVNRLVSCLFGLTTTSFSEEDGISATLSINSLSISPAGAEISYLLEADTAQALAVAMEEQKGIERLSEITFDEKESLPGVLPAEDNEFITAFLAALAEAAGTSPEYARVVSVCELGYFREANADIPIVSIGVEVLGRGATTESLLLSNLAVPANACAELLVHVVEMTEVEE
ncbi:MAG: hypothetical protein LBR14_03520 [Clostridiales Family XIII bacterium]|jgi:dipeptidase D|nr:hypothetical protein [Clostridiales Family XIII bacterium]